MHRLVPSFITTNLSQNRRQGTFSGAALFVDISGFTRITEALMGHGQHGAEVMATVMRAIFTPLVRSVFEQGGFVTNFAGDALTAVFPTPDENQKEAVLRSLAAAWQIQEHMATNAQQKTRYGDFTFSAKVGLAAGEVTWGIITAEPAGRATYYFKGPAIEGCAAAEKVAQAGDIIANSTAYEAIGSSVSAREVDGNWRIRHITTTLPHPQAINLPDPDLEQIARFFPRSLVEQEISGEFRQILSLFISLQGSPDHADLSAFMQQLFRLQESYGGLLNRVDFADKGCHLLIFWGAPVSYENDVTRVLDFILELCEASKLPLRAGVTYRIAHAGSIGSSLAEEYTAHGRGVNLAARHMMAADWGEIWLDGQVARRAETEFALRSLGSKSFKGFAEHQPVYLLDGRRERTVAAFGAGPLIGREHELRRLQEALVPIYEERFAGVVVVSGEAGIGKSRLIQAFLDERELQQQTAVFLCQTDEILRQSLNPFRYFLRHYFEQSTTLDESANKRRFEQIHERLLWSIPDEEMKTELERVRSFLGSLVGLRWEGSLYEQLDPELRYENTLGALKTLFKAESTNGPVIIQLEDAHWLDQDSIEFLERLTRNVAGFPFALLVTSRTELPRELFAADAPQEIVALQALQDDNVTELATAVLGRTPSASLLGLLAERTDGNPFFMEQMLLYLQENDLLERVEESQETTLPGDIYVPTDVRAVLTARLDRLPQAVQDVVQKAAVLGREFEISILEFMMDHDLQLDSKLETAANDAIWFALDGGSYFFRHALLRDAAYDMQLHSRLRQLHKSAAQAFEDQHKQDLDLAPRYPEVAYHFDKAEETEQALLYYGKAGGQAKENYNNAEAISYFSRGLELSDHDNYQSRYSFLCGRETIYQWMGQREEQEKDLTQLAELMSQHPDDLKQADLALRQSAYALVTGDYDTAVADASKSLRFAKNATDKIAKARAYHRWGRTLWQQGHAKEAEGYLRHALDLAQNGESLDLNADCLYDLGMVFRNLARNSEAKSILEQAAGVYEDLDDKQGLVRCQNLFGVINYDQGHLIESHHHYMLALDLCREAGWRYAETYILINIGNSYTDLGDHEHAFLYLSQALDLSKETGDRHAEAVSLDLLGLITSYESDFVAAVILYQQALEIRESVTNQRSKAYVLTHLGYTQAQIGKYKEAELNLLEAQKIRQALNEEALIMDTISGLALVAFLKGDLSGSLSFVNTILSWFKKNSSEGLEFPVQVYLICYRIISSAAHVDQNLQAEAETVLEDGHALLMERLDRIKDEGIREQFMEQVPYNRELHSTWLSKRG